MQIEPIITFGLSTVVTILKICHKFILNQQHDVCLFSQKNLKKVYYYGRFAPVARTYLIGSEPIFS